MAPSSDQVVQTQLDAYNARDLDAWVATYAENARQYEYPANLLATGRAEIRERMRARFAEPTLQAVLLERVVLGDLVIDHEAVNRVLPSGLGRVELIAIYEVRDGFIQTATFRFGGPLG